MHSHSFQDTELKLAGIGLGQPGAGRGGVKNIEGAPRGGGGGIHIIFERCKGPGNAGQPS